MQSDYPFCEPYLWISEIGISLFCCSLLCHDLIPDLAVPLGKCLSAPVTPHQASSEALCAWVSLAAAVTMSSAMRRCWLCQKTGARRYQDLGPLMHLAINEKGTDLKWLHRQCLLWSPEVHIPVSLSFVQTEGCAQPDLKAVAGQ
jgi:hypothetical protein